MLELINRYCHGYVAIPVILACKTQGLFKLLEKKGALSASGIAKRLKANEGHLQVALRLMQSLGWLSCNKAGEYSLTSTAQTHQHIPEAILEIYQFSFDQYLNSNELTLQNWLNWSKRRWDVESPLWSDFLDGVLLVPLLVALVTNKILPPSCHQPLFFTLKSSVYAELSEFMLARGWCEQSEDQLSLTNTGQFMAEHALNMGVTASYRPLLCRIADVLFGNEKEVFARDAFGYETHVNRTLNVMASGFQHEKYFTEVETVLLETFNGLPYDAQPHYIVDMGCGDGSLLKRIYTMVCAKTARGRVLAYHPLTVIGVDVNEAAIAVAEETLRDIPHQVFQGDIGNPQQLLTDLQVQGIALDKVLHIRSFLDHDRPYIPPVKKPGARSHIPYHGVFVDKDGKSIDPAEMVQSLVEHFKRWAAVVGQHGLLVLEAHCLDPLLSRRYLDQSESFHFDALQSFSKQYLVEADVFLMAAAEAGLFPKSEAFRHYPQLLPYSRITLNHFEKRPYVVRHACLDDLSYLLELENQCWLKPLRATSTELKERLTNYPQGQCVVEKEEKVVGVLYSQRIAQTTDLENRDFRQIAKLHVLEGPILQLIAINILPEMQDQGLGDQLLEFMLQKSALTAGIEQVLGITRCRDYTHYKHIPFEKVYQSP